MGVLIYAVILLILGAIFVGVAYWAHRTTLTAQVATNRLLFSIVVLLFAIVLKLVSNGLDVFVFVIALVGLGIGWFAVSVSPQVNPRRVRQVEEDVAD